MNTSKIDTAKQLFLAMQLFPTEPVVRTMLKADKTLSRESARNAILALYQWLSATLLRQGADQMVMYSQAVDDAHHAFILNTRIYHDFCQQFFAGSYFHHDPFDAEVTPVQDVACHISFTFDALDTVFGTELSSLLRERIIRHQAGDILTVAEICCLSDRCISPGSPANLTLQEA